MNSTELSWSILVIFKKTKSHQKNFCKNVTDVIRVSVFVYILFESNLIKSKIVRVFFVYDVSTIKIKLFVLLRHKNHLL